MDLTESVAAAVGESTEPAAALALAYAERIDACDHRRLALDRALADLAAGILAADDRDAATAALDRVAAELSAVTVLGDLGPKLLAALDALTLTPRSRAAVVGKVAGASTPVSPLDALRDNHAARRLRSTG